jgi:hypothetical protein
VEIAPFGDLKMGTILPWGWRRKSPPRERFEDELRPQIYILFLIIFSHNMYIHLFIYDAYKSHKIHNNILIFLFAL